MYNHADLFASQNLFDLHTWYLTNPLGLEIYSIGSVPHVIQIRNNPGGDTPGDPRHFWVWEAEAQQFTPHLGLERLSAEGKITLRHWIPREAVVGYFSVVTYLSDDFVSGRSYWLPGGELSLLGVLNFQTLKKQRITLEKINKKRVNLP